MKILYVLLRRAVAVMFIGAFACAQVATKHSLNNEGAREVINAAKHYASKVNAPGAVIAVVDDGGNLVALERLDGTFAAGAQISIGKARTAVQFKRPTKFFEDVIKNGRTSMVALDSFTPLQGGIPITIDGEVIGGVGVSGASSAQQDEEVAIAGAKALMDPVKVADVRYFPAPKVESSFASGAVLFDGAGGNYMIHTSRREKAGLAEVHLMDADLIYVQQGTATFVTGGTVLAPKSIAADEIRGEAIDGGETRELAKGDVLIVPAGTPHWFKNVSEPFLYYVVKAR